MLHLRLGDSHALAPLLEQGVGKICEELLYYRISHNFISILASGILSAICVVSSLCDYARLNLLPRLVYSVLNPNKDQILIKSDSSGYLITH